MQTYIEAVREAVEKKLDKRFANSSVQHAEVLIKAVIYVNLQRFVLKFDKIQKISEIF